MGARKAPLAIACKILVATFHMLQRSVALADLGADDFDRVDKQRTAKRLVRRLDASGYAVMLYPKPANQTRHDTSARWTRPIHVNFRASQTQFQQGPSSALIHGEFRSSHREWPRTRSMA